MAKAKKATQTEAPIKALKGFDKNLQCRGFQFEVGKTYEQTGNVICCESGFHAVVGSPLDIWNYYPIIGDGSLNRFAEVTLSGSMHKAADADDSKIAAAKITVDVEIKLPEFIKRAVAWVVEATKGAGDDPSGHYARIGSSGHSAQIGSSGHSARIGSSGHYARIVVEGANSVVASAGRATVSGPAGTWVSLAEFDRNGKCVGFATGCIGKDGLMPSTAYRAENGKLVAA